VRRFLDALSAIGAKITPGGSLTRPAAPLVSLFELDAEDFKPYLRDMVRYKLTVNLAERSAKISTGKKGRSAFDALDPHIDWEASPSLLKTLEHPFLEGAPEEDVSRVGSSARHFSSFPP
jgi:hypothetical protein